MGGKGQSCHEGIDAAEGKACGMDSVIEGRYESEEDRHLVDDLISTKEGIGEREDDEGDGQGVKEHEHRNGCFDDGGKAEKSDQEGNESKDGDPFLEGKEGEETGEIFAAGSDEAYTGGEAGKKDNDAHHDISKRPKIMMSRTD